MTVCCPACQGPGKPSPSFIYSSKLWKSPFSKDLSPHIGLLSSPVIQLPPCLIAVVFCRAEPGRVTVSVYYLRWYFAGLNLDVLQSVFTTCGGILQGWTWTFYSQCLLLAVVFCRAEPGRFTVSVYYLRWYFAGLNLDVLQSVFTICGGILQGWTWPFYSQCLLLAVVFCRAEPGRFTVSVYYLRWYFAGLNLDVLQSVFTTCGGILQRWTWTFYSQCLLLAVVFCRTEPGRFTVSVYYLRWYFAGLNLDVLQSVFTTCGGILQGWTWTFYSQCLLFAVVFCRAEPGRFTVSVYYLRWYFAGLNLDVLQSVFTICGGILQGWTWTFYSQCLLLAVVFCSAEPGRFTVSVYYLRWYFAGLNLDVLQSVFTTCGGILQGWTWTFYSQCLLLAVVFCRAEPGRFTVSVYYLRWYFAGLNLDVLQSVFTTCGGILQGWTWTFYSQCLLLAVVFCRAEPGRVTVSVYYLRWYFAGLNLDVLQSVFTICGGILQGWTWTFYSQCLLFAVVFCRAEPGRFTVSVYYLRWYFAGLNLDVLQSVFTTCGGILQGWTWTFYSQCLLLAVVFCRTEPGRVTVSVYYLRWYFAGLNLDVLQSVFTTCGGILQGWTWTCYSQCLLLAVVFCRAEPGRFTVSVYYLRWYFAGLNLDVLQSVFTICGGILQGWTWTFYSQCLLLAVVFCRTEPGRVTVSVYYLRWYFAGLNLDVLQSVFTICGGILQGWTWTFYSQCLLLAVVFCSAEPGRFTVSVYYLRWYFAGLNLDVLQSVFTTCGGILQGWTWTCYSQCLLLAVVFCRTEPGRFTVSVYYLRWYFAGLNLDVLQSVFTTCGGILQGWTWTFYSQCLLFAVVFCRAEPRRFTVSVYYLPWCFAWLDLDVLQSVFTICRGVLQGWTWTFYSQCLLLAVVFCRTEPGRVTVSVYYLRWYFAGLNLDVLQSVFTTCGGILQGWTWTFYSQCLLFAVVFCRGEPGRFTVSVYYLRWYFAGLNLDVLQSVFTICGGILQGWTWTFYSQCLLLAVVFCRAEPGRFKSVFITCGGILQGWTWTFYSQCLLLAVVFCRAEPGRFTVSVYYLRWYFAGLNLTVLQSVFTTCGGILQGWTWPFYSQCLLFAVVFCRAEPGRFTVSVYYLRWYFAGLNLDVLSQCLLLAVVFCRAEPGRFTVSVYYLRWCFAGLNLDVLQSVFTTCGGILQGWTWTFYSQCLLLAVVFCRAEPGRFTVSVYYLRWYFAGLNLDVLQSVFTICGGILQGWTWPFYSQCLLFAVVFCKAEPGRFTVSVYYLRWCFAGLNLDVLQSVFTTCGGILQGWTWTFYSQCLLFAVVFCSAEPGRVTVSVYYLRWYFAGLNLAVFRGEDGRAHVVDAYCPHIGANMAVGGRVSGSCIECPFHGWKFRGDDGKCTHIPTVAKSKFGFLRSPFFAVRPRWRNSDISIAIF